MAIVSIICILFDLVFLFDKNIKETEFYQEHETACYLFSIAVNLIFISILATRIFS